MSPTILLIKCNLFLNIYFSVWVKIVYMETMWDIKTLIGMNAMPSVHVISRDKPQREIKHSN